MASTGTIKLAQLGIDEVSGVDDPANALPGFMVAKAKDAEASDAQTSSTPPSGDDAADAASSAPADTPQGALAIVGKIRDLVLRTGKEEVDMTKEELNEGLETFGKNLVEEIAKALTPAPVEAAEETPAAEAAPAVEAPAVDAEALTKAVEDTIEKALAPVLEILDKALDQIDTLNSVVSGSTRKSIEGQEAPEDGVEAPEAPKLGDAIAKALNRS